MTWALGMDQTWVLKHVMAYNPGDNKGLQHAVSRNDVTLGQKGCGMVRACFVCISFAYI